MVVRRPVGLSRRCWPREGIPSCCTLYTLVLFVCLAASPHSCEVHEQTADDLAAHPSTAFVQAQALVARWLDEHPEYQVRRWRLRPGKGA